MTGDKRAQEAKLRIGVLISGRGSNFEALAKAIDEYRLPAAICAVLSDQPEAKGLDIARSRGIPTEVIERRPKSLTSEAFNTQLALTLKKYNAELIVLAGFMRIIHPVFIEAFGGHVINIHPALLPSFKGVDAQGQALEAGVKFAGCSVHYVTSDVDCGPIIAQAVVPVLPSDTHDTLAARILKREHMLLPAVVAAIAQGQVRLRGGKVEIDPSCFSCSDEDQLTSIRTLRA